MVILSLVFTSQSSVINGGSEDNKTGGSIETGSHISFRLKGNSIGAPKGGKGE